MYILRRFFVFVCLLYFFSWHFFVRFFLSGPRTICWFFWVCVFFLLLISEFVILFFHYYLCVANNECTAPFLISVQWCFAPMVKNGKKYIRRTLVLICITICISTMQFIIVFFFLYHVDLFVHAYVALFFLIWSSCFVLEHDAMRV